LVDYSHRQKLPGFDHQQQYFNADFRFGLVRVRESSEQIALYRGEKVEDIKLKNLFSRIFDNYINIIKIQRNLTFFQNGYELLSYLISYLIGTPLYFAKKIIMGGIIQISIAFRQVQLALSVFVSLFTTLASWRAIIYRLTEFSNRIQEANHTLTHKPITIVDHDTNELITHKLSLTLPNGTPLLNNLQINIKSGDKLLFTGASGVGKSTLLRTLAGIWPYGHGKISIPLSKKFMFLPQKPYLPLGTLREALAYPNKTTDFTEEKFSTVLKLCNLEKFQYELAVVRNWSQELSQGEQQLIAFARIFLKKPDWIFLDEATSALDEPLEIKMYETLYQQLPDATVISVGHRRSLQQFHEKKIEITLDGNNF
jgi:putative ATP-binding cassette transporter